MKKIILLILSGFVLAAIFSSCKKDEIPPEKFSTLSVEENKATVEDAGIDFIQTMDRMKSLQTIDVVANLTDIMESSGKKGPAFVSNSRLFSVLGTCSSAAEGHKKLNDVFDSMISIKGEDPESLQEFWDENVGTYTWNPSLEDWDISLGGNNFVFNFPSSDAAASNDAVFTISNYTGVEISDPLDEEYTGDLPASLNADLKVGAKTLITLVYGAQYNTDGIPNAIAADLDIEGFKFEVDITNSTNLASVTYKFLEESNIIMKLTASGNGLFTKDNYDDNTIPHSETYTYTDYVWNEETQQYEEVEETWTDEWEETDFEEIIHSAKVDFQLLNIAIRGDIDIKSLVDQLNIIDENEDLDEETANENYAEKINEYLNLRLVNVSNNEIMAKAEAYVVHETEYEYEDIYVDFRLTFADGSPIDFETYLNEGFDSFVRELNSLIDDINTDYDLGIDPVDY